MIIFKRISYSWLFIFFTLAFQFACNQHEDKPHVYHFIQPEYNTVQLSTVNDSIRFDLDEEMYNDIKSFNYFENSQAEYMSFYDRRSESIYIYTLADQAIFKKIKIKSFFRNDDLYKTSVFIKNWDSIFIINKTYISLYDSAGNRKKRIDFLNDPHYAWAVFDGNKLPVLNGKKMFAIVRPNVKYQSLKAVREWKVLYEFDLEKGSAQLNYHLPAIYRKNLYSYNFFHYNYCFNDKNRFVFSFPADTTIYETDLIGYFHSYFARSQFQVNPILPVSEQALEKREESREFALRDSYGSIFFDPNRKYYLRLVRHRLTEKEYQAKKRKRTTILILNNEFKIIGESSWPDEVDFSSLFFTKDGKMYARTHTKDENALHFIRIAYSNNTDLQLTQK